MQGKRSTRVGDLIQREVAYILLEKVRDPRVEGITITGLSLTRDLKLARVYFSVMGGEGTVEKGQAGLDSAKGFIKREIAANLELKYIPEIRFIHDASLERGTRMERLFQDMAGRNSGTGDGEVESE